MAHPIPTSQFLTQEEIDRFCKLIANCKNLKDFNHAIQALVYVATTKAQEPLIELCYENGLSISQIAKALNVTKQAVSLQFPARKYRRTK